MTTQTMLEKLAKAIRKDWTGVEWDQPSEDPRMDHEDAFCVARAALQFLREPTEEMVDAGSGVYPASEGWLGPDGAKECWREMIDAILQEKA